MVQVPERHERKPSVTKRQLSIKREHKLAKRQEVRLDIQMSYQNGVPIDQIERKHSKYLVKTWINEYKINGNKLSYMSKPIPGRPLKVTPGSELEDDIIECRKTMSLFRISKFLTKKYKRKEGYMKNEKEWSISESTISNYLNSIGCKSMATGRQPAITPDQEKKRVKLAEELKDQNLEKFVFVDETWAVDHGRTNCRNDRQWVFDKKEIVPRKVVAHPAKIGYFGGVGFNGVTPLIEIFRDDKPTFEEKELNKSKKKLEKLQEEKRKLDEEEQKRLDKIAKKEAKAVEAKAAKLLEQANKSKVKRTLSQIRKEAKLRDKIKQKEREEKNQEKTRIREEKQANKEREKEEKKIARIEKKMAKAGKKALRNRTTAKIYLEKCLKPLIKYLNSIFPEKDYTIVHDGAPYHTAKLVENYLRRKQIKFIGGGKSGKWPGNSADIQPAENGWAITKGNAYRESTGSLDELDKRFREAWNNISIDTCQKMITGMKKRFEKVIELKGKYIGK